MASIQPIDTKPPPDCEFCGAKWEYFHNYKVQVSHDPACPISDHARRLALHHGLPVPTHAAEELVFIETRVLMN